MGTTLVVVGAVQGSNHDERRNWREPRSPAVIFRSDKRLPAGAVWLTIEILHSRRHSRRLTLILAGWFFPRDRSTTSSFYLPFLFFFSPLFLSQPVTDLVAVQLWHLSRWRYEYAISRSRFVSRVTVPARFAFGLLVVQTNRRPLSNDEDYARRDWLSDARDHADAFTTIDA